MMFPDCRQDEYYNYDFLNDIGKSMIDGFDGCAQSIGNALDNMDDFNDDELDVKPSDIEAVAGALREWLAAWLESERDELITGLIDDMDDDEFSRLRAAAIAENGREKYFDTRHYACTGVKVFHDDKP